MASIWETLGLRTAQPVAGARITRTPIYAQKMPPGMAATYQNDRINIDPMELQNYAARTLPHEEAHAIFDRANLKNLGAKLASHVGPAARNFVLGSSVYKSMPDYGSDEQLADEGLGRSIGDEDETPYVNYAASQIQNPALKAQLLRLHQNAIGGRKSRNIVQ